MDTGDSNFSQPPSAFILLPSQEETQQESQAEEQMRHILTTLPALQPPHPTERKPEQTLHIDLGETSTEEDTKKDPSKVLVADSEMDTQQKHRETTETSDVVSESMVESDGHADVTVVEKRTKADSDMIADTEVSTSSPVEPDRSSQEVVLVKSRSQSSSPTNESSFQSKDRSNLGSYDQCELYRTQNGHAHGQRFRLFQSSQEDMFGDNADEDDMPISTPAEHIGSLHLSSKPMLVPETVDEMESEVPISPPLIIPASPTDIEPTEDETEYNVNEVNTLADYSKGFDFSGSSSSSKGSVNKTVLERQQTPADNHQHITATEEQEFVMRSGPTLAGDVEQSQEPESLHLHLSMSHPSGSTSAYQQNISPERNTESPEIIEYVTETPKKIPGTEVSSSQNVDKSSVDQSEGRIVRVSTPRMKAPPALSREATRTPEDVIIIDSSTGDVVEVEEEQLSLRLTPSQGEKTQNKIRPTSQSQKSAQGKKSRHKRDINYNPIVVWQDHEDIELIPVKDPVDLTDTGEGSKVTSLQVGTNKSSSGDKFSEDFHLSLPKNGDLLHPVKGGVSMAIREKEQMQRDPHSTESIHVSEESERTVEASIDLPKSPTLTLSMIQVESEVVSEPVFRLEKPEILPTDLEAQGVSEDIQKEDVFKRAKIKHTRKHWKYVQEEDSDDDYISPKKPSSKTEGAESIDVNLDMFEQSAVNQPQIVQSVTEKDESNDNTLSYNVDTRTEPSKIGSHDDQGQVVPQDTEMEVLEAIPLELAEGHSPLTTESSQQIGGDSLKTPKRPKMPHGSSVGSQMGRSANVQNILKAYTDIITKQASPRQRSASIDITNLSRSEAKSLTRRFSQDVAPVHSLPLSKDTQSEKMSQLVIQTHMTHTNGVSKGSSVSPRGGSVSPKGGTASPKGGSWMSARKGSSESLQKSESKQNKNGDSPNSNPPKSPKGIDIAELSQELLQSFRQSKRSHRENGHKNPGNHLNSNDKHRGDKVKDDSKTVNDSENTVLAVTAVECTPSKNLLSSPPSKTMLSTPKTPDSVHVSTPSRPTGLENLNLSGCATLSQDQNRTSLPEVHNIISIQKSTSDVVSPKVKFGEGSTSKKERRQRTKKLISSAERMKRRTSVDSNTSAQMTTGSFVNSTQRILQKETSIEPWSTTSGTQDPSRVQGRDPYSFQGSQSQSASREVRSASRVKRYTSSSFERTPTSTRKRRKVIYKKSGIKKQKVSDESGNPGTHSAKQAEKLTSPTSQSSDITVTTIGSSVSIPSSISQSSPKRQTVLSPSSSGSKSSTGGGSITQKRLSIEPLPDTLPLQSEDDNYQRVTIETKVVKRYIMETETQRRVIGSQGQVLESSTEIQKGEPVILEEKTHKKVQLVYVPSPSRSVSSLTPGDLADVSSSLSRSGSSSLGSKVSISGGSLDSQKSPDLSQAPRKSLDQSEASKANQSQKDVRSSQLERRTSEFAEPLPSTSKQPYELTRKDTPKQKAATPENTSKPQSTGFTPKVPSTSVIPSDTDGSDVGTPLGSTINKTGSFLHSRTVSTESPRPVEVSKRRGSPKASDSLFSSTEEKGDNQEPVQTRRRSSGTSDASLIPAGQKRLSTQVAPRNGQKPDKSSSGSSDHISPEIPYQDQAISSSGENTNIVPSTGEPGSRVIAKWKDGFYYPGTVKGKDRYGRFQVRFDDGDSMTVKIQDVLLVEKLPVGQSVMVQTKDGYFESGMIVQQKSSEYVIEADTGSSGLYAQSEVILTADQAACLISDRGSEIMVELPGQQLPPANVGDVSLEKHMLCILHYQGIQLILAYSWARPAILVAENLLDAPRRSAKKLSAPEAKVKEEEKVEGQGPKSRKRKLDTLQPKATSTPTPKGKQETSPKKKKTATAATGLMESPLTGATSSPVCTRKSPCKARVGLFSGDLGPLPTKKIFKGMLFLLTNVDKTAEQRKQERQLLQDSSLETSTDESAVEEEVAVAFDKNHLKSQIEAGGGKVLDNFDKEKVESSKKCFLLSSSCQRTIKYLQCLACGVVCVAHSWVVNSCTENQLLDHKSYILPAGISLEKKKIVECKKSKTDVLVGVKAFVFSKNPKFCESWSEILRLAKCTVLPKPQYSELDVIITDSSCTPAMVRQAETHSVPLVSTEWVIQSLVNGKPVKYDGHPRYQHDFMI